MLTANEFLQMSGRAGRRGMDKIGYVVVMGTQFQTPDEVADLVKSSSNPLESQFSPSYSMVLNLLQNLELEQAKELILKSFGYFSSNDRLKPIIMQQIHCEQTLAKLKAEKSLATCKALGYCSYHQRVLPNQKKKMTTQNGQRT